MTKIIKIICHRGLWEKKSEQNKFISFQKIEYNLNDNEILLLEETLTDKINSYFKEGRRYTFNEGSVIPRLNHTNLRKLEYASGFGAEIFSFKELEFLYNLEKFLILIVLTYL